MPVRRAISATHSSGSKARSAAVSSVRRPAARVFATRSWSGRRLATATRSDGSSALTSSPSSRSESSAPSRCSASSITSTRGSNKEPGELADQLACRGERVEALRPAREALPRVSEAPGAAAAIASTMRISSTPGARSLSEQLTQATRGRARRAPVRGASSLPNPAPAVSNNEPRSIASRTRPARRGRGIARPPPNRSALSVGRLLSLSLACTDDMSAVGLRQEVGLGVAPVQPPLRKAATCVKALHRALAGAHARRRPARSGTGRR